MTKHTGTNYHLTKGLDTKAIAQLVRRDLKAAGVKAGVRIERFSGGSSIGVYIKPDWFLGLADDLAMAKLQDAEDILNSYNRTDSDMMTDYYNTNFYGDVYVGKKGVAAESAHNLRVRVKHGDSVAQAMKFTTDCLAA